MSEHKPLGTDMEIRKQSSVPEPLGLQASGSGASSRGGPVDPAGSGPEADGLARRHELRQR
jgi:hypothetical protein